MRKHMPSSVVWGYLLLGGILAGCGDAGPGEPPEPSLLGRWTADSTDELNNISGVPGNVKLTFLPDGTFSKEGDSSMDGDFSMDEAKGTYTRSGNTVTLSDPEDEARGMTFKIKALTETTLALELVGEPPIFDGRAVVFTFNRAPND